MNYILNIQLKPLIWVEVNANQVINIKREFKVKAKSNYKNKSIVKNACIYIPFPKDLNNPLFKIKNGTVSYLPSKETIQWKLEHSQGNRNNPQIPPVRAENRDKSMKYFVD